VKNMTQIQINISDNQISYSPSGLYFIIKKSWCHYESISADICTKCGNNSLSYYHGSFCCQV